MNHLVAILFFLSSSFAFSSPKSPISIEGPFTPKALSILPSEAPKSPDAGYIPNDLLFGSQWALKNPQSAYDLGVTSAWQKGRGNKKIAIVVIDTGIDYNHPDIKNNMWVNPNEIAGNGVDDDGNGYVDDVHGINAITGRGDPMDDNGHGTFMAGVIGAEGDNGIGIAGVMHDVSLIACKFLDSNGTGHYDDAVKCLDYALALSKRDIGVSIVATNNSWGSGEESDALLQAIARHRDAGILFVTSSGSSASSLEDKKVYPASYDLANIVVVAKANKEGKLSLFSNYGQNSVHLAAPGEDILSTTIGGAYQVWSGSVAGAFVSGLLGLMKSLDEDLSWAQLKYKLLKNTLELSDPNEAYMLISGGLASILNF